MDILKKRGVAVVITVLVICLSTIFSTHRTLGGQVRELGDSFYTGVQQEGWNTSKPSIDTQLNKRADASNGAVSIAAGYPELERETDALRTTRKALLEAEDISGKYAANKELGLAFDELLSASRYVELSEREAEAFEEYEKTMRGTQALIDSSGYNEQIRSFQNSTLDVFPANILKSAAMLPELELFE